MRLPDVATPWMLLSLLCLPILLLPGCGSGDFSGPPAGSVDPASETPTEEPPPEETPGSEPYADPILNTLHSLGVSLEDPESPRVEADGRVLPQSYAPLGAQLEVSRPAELLLAGFRLVDPDLGVIDEGSIIERLPETEFEPERTSLLHTTPYNAWLGSRIRRAVGADLDEDGVHEVVIAHLPDGGDLQIQVLEDASGAYALTRWLTFSDVVGSDVVDLDLAAGDLDGDDLDELVLAVSYTDGVGRLFVIDQEDDQLVIVDEATKSYAVDQDHELILLVDIGNLDWDHAAELAVVVNDTWHDQLSGRTLGAATYVVYDDHLQGLAELSTGTVAVPAVRGGAEPGPDTEDAVAVFANVLFCDVDADRVDEVVFAGLDTFRRADQDSSMSLVLLALEDGRDDLTAFTRIGERWSPVNYGYVGNEEDHEYREVRHVWLEKLDFDGDGHDEILANHIVYENFQDAEEPFRVFADLGASSLFPTDVEYVLTRRNCAVAVGDVNEDGRAEVHMLAPSAAPGAYDRIRVLEWTDVPDAPGAVRVSYLDVLKLDEDPQTQAVDLMIVPVDVDDDNIVLQSVPNSHTVVYTEPIVMAALASPPCKYGIGQNLESCTTSYGRSASISHTEETSLIQTVHFGIGTKSPPAAQAEVEMAGTLDTEFKLTFGVTKSVTTATVFTTGPQEDTVIFTTIPYDRYEYRVLHHKQAGMRGTRYYVMNPREPQTLMVQREFFNRVTSPDSIKIDESVFGHQIGDPTTYPTAAEKDAVLAAQTKDHPAYQNGAQRVGQGRGSVELSLAIGREQTAGFEAEIVAGFHFEASAGVLIQIDIGYGVGFALSLTRGQEMSYTGVVGNIDAEHFVDEQYSFGLFTHYHSDPGTGQTFEVVDYWVE